MFFRPLTDAGPPGLPGDPGDPGEPGEPEVPILPMALMAPMAQAESLGNVETAVAKPMPPAGPPRDMGPPTPATPMPFAAPMAPVAPFAVALESPWATAYAAGDPPESLADPDAPLTVFDFALYPAWEPLDNEVAGEMKLSSTLLCMALDSDLSNVVAAVFGAQFRPQGARVKPYVALNSLELTNAVMELPAVLIGADENGGSGEDLNLDAESLLQVANEMAPQKQKAVRANLPGVEVHPDPRAGQEAVSPDVEMLINSPFFKAQTTAVDAAPKRGRVGGVATPSIVQALVAGEPNLTSDFAKQLYWCCAAYARDLLNYAKDTYEDGDALGFSWNRVERADPYLETVDVRLQDLSGTDCVRAAVLMLNVLESLRGLTDNILGRQANNLMDVITTQLTPVFGKLCLIAYFAVCTLTGTRADFRRFEESVARVVAAKAAERKAEKEATAADKKAQKEATAADKKAQKEATAAAKREATAAAKNAIKEAKKEALQQALGAPLGVIDQLVSIDAVLSPMSERDAALHEEMRGVFEEAVAQHKGGLESFPRNVKYKHLHTKLKDVNVTLLNATLLKVVDKAWFWVAVVAHERWPSDASPEHRNNAWNFFTRYTHSGAQLTAALVSRNFDPSLYKLECPADESFDEGFGLLTPNADPFGFSLPDEPDPLDPNGLFGSPDTASLSGPESMTHAPSSMSDDAAALEDVYTDPSKGPTQRDVQCAVANWALNMWDTAEEHLISARTRRDQKQTSLETREANELAMRNAYANATPKSAQVTESATPASAVHSLHVNSFAGFNIAQRQENLLLLESTGSFYGNFLGSVELAQHSRNLENALYPLDSTESHTVHELARYCKGELGLPSLFHCREARLLREKVMQALVGLFDPFLSERENGGFEFVPRGFLVRGQVDNGDQRADEPPLQRGRAPPELLEAMALYKAKAYTDNPGNNRKSELRWRSFKDTRLLEGVLNLGPANLMLRRAPGSHFSLHEAIGLADQMQKPSGDLGALLRAAGDKTTYTDEVIFLAPGQMAVFDETLLRTPLDEMPWSSEDPQRAMLFSARVGSLCSPEGRASQLDMGYKAAAEKVVTASTVKYPTADSKQALYFQHPALAALSWGLPIPQLDGDILSDLQEQLQKFDVGDTEEIRCNGDLGECKPSQSSSDQLLLLRDIASKALPTPQPPAAEERTQ